MPKPPPAKEKLRNDGLKFQSVTVIDARLLEIEQERKKIDERLPTAQVVVATGKYVG
jgi:hypothetical protein